jgi:hypothetical protein
VKSLFYMDLGRRLSVVIGDSTIFGAFIFVAIGFIYVSHSFIYVCVPFIYVYASFIYGSTPSDKNRRTLHSPKTIKKQVRIRITLILRPAFVFYISFQADFSRSFFLGQMSGQSLCLFSVTASETIEYMLFRPCSDASN